MQGFLCISTLYVDRVVINVRRNDLQSRYTWILHVDTIEAANGVYIANEDSHFRIGSKLIF